MIIATMVSIIISASLHEFMHGYVALKLGDDLAYLNGRLSLNPLRHIDPFLTILLPLIMILTTGTPILAAKPVPINVNRLRGREMGMALVGVAGPLTNLLLAVIVGLFIRLGDISYGNAFYDVVLLFFYINIGLFVFNMMPLPPLDGSRVLYAFAPEPVQRFMEQIESFGVFGVIIFISLLSPVIGPVIFNIETSLAKLIIG